jgi:hypothetical protein
VSVHFEVDEQVAVITTVRLVRSFGRGGVAGVSLPKGPATGRALLLQPDGRLVVVGTAECWPRSRILFALAPRLVRA